MRTARDVPTPLACRKIMISRMARCSAQPVAIPSARFGPIPATSRSRCGSACDAVEHLVAEGPDEFTGISRANAAGHPGAEIFFDSLCRGGRHRFQEPGAELHAMGAIVGPFAARLDELPGGNDRNMTDDGDGFTLAARLHAQNAETVVFVMKRYTLDEAS